MKYKPILLITGEPRSIFLEIFFKSIKNSKYKSPLILITSKKDLVNQMRKFRFKKKIRDIKVQNIKHLKIDNNKINLINVDFLISKNSKQKYIKNCFDIAFKLIKNNFSKKLINGPINKKTFLEKKISWSYRIYCF